MITEVTRQETIAEITTSQNASTYPSPQLEPSTSNSIPQRAEAAPVEDVPTTALEIVHAMIAMRLKKPLAHISTSKSLKELSSGG